MNFLAVDVGNTTLTAGVFTLKGSRPFEVLKIPSDESPERIKKMFEHLAKKEIAGLAVASVVPSLDRLLKKICRETFHPAALWIMHKTQTGVRIRTQAPSQVGADRIVNAAAAHKLFRRKTIVIDFGTATTFDCVNERGDYLGGVICPGPKLSARALEAHTAKLPFVALARPRRAIGKNTADCIRSGLFYGYIGLIREILSRVQKEMGGGALVIATGGDAALISPHVPNIRRVEPYLTLQGIKLIWEMTR